MRFIIFIGILLALDVYAFQAFRTLTHGWSASLRLAMAGLYWLAPAVLLLSVILVQTGLAEHTPKALATLARSFLFIAYISKFIIASFVLADDIRRSVLWLYEQVSGKHAFDYSRSRFLSAFGIALGSVPFLTLTYGMVRNPYRYKLHRVKARLPHLPPALEGLRIVQISDIHSGSFLYKEPVKAAVELINAQKPDLVLFTGDLVNNTADEMIPFLDVFDKIEARYGVYSVLGNHDYGDYVPWPSPEAKAANLERLKQVHAQLGWNLLLNENRILSIGGSRLAIIGVENYSTHLRFPKYGDLAKAWQGTQDADLKILLSHDPSHWHGQVTSQFPDIDLTFSGHTHGMQFGVEIPGIIKWSPVQYVYKEWAGLYQSGKQYLYVNRGLGYLGYPGRVGILPEVTLMELERQA